VLWPSFEGTSRITFRSHHRAASVPTGVEAQAPAVILGGELIPLVRRPARGPDSMPQMPICAPRRVETCGVRTHVLCGMLASAVLGADAELADWIAPGAQPTPSFEARRSVRPRLAPEGCVPSTTPAWGGAVWSRHPTQIPEGHDSRPDADARAEGCVGYVGQVDSWADFAVWRSRGRQGTTMLPSMMAWRSASSRGRKRSRKPPL
jgi:hypothetical protein